MRKFTYLVAVLAMAMGTQSVFGQTATRNGVATEVFTGTWCTFCPGSAMAADELYANGDPAVIVEHHIGDQWEIPVADARDTYFGITGYPTAWFDGTVSEVGGNATQSIYGTYQPRVAAGIQVATPFDLTLTAVENGNNIDVSAVITQQGTYSGPLRLQVIAIESHLYEAWLAGLTEVNFVNRGMYPNDQGTAITIAQGQTVTENMSITKDAGWDLFNMHIVAFVENGTSKEVFNADWVSLATPTGQIDPSIADFITEINSITCATSMTPEIQIHNLGSDALTALTISYAVNGGTASTYNWTGNLDFNDRANVMLPTINFTPNATNNQLTVTITDVNNGQIGNDIDANNNDVAASWDYERNGGNFTMNLQLDNYGSETTWSVMDGNMNTVASGGPYTDQNPQLITESMTLNNTECYTFQINDSYGDGICCTYGQGYFEFLDPSNVLMTNGGSFGSTDSRDWHVMGGPVAIEDVLVEGVNVYPNPSNGVFNVAMGDGFTGEATIVVMQLDGKEVYRATAGSDLVKLDLSDLSSGMYLMQVRTADKVVTKKLTKE